MAIMALAVIITLIANVEYHEKDGLMQKALCRLYCMDHLIKSNRAIVLCNCIVQICIVGIGIALCK